MSRYVKLFHQYVMLFLAKFLVGRTIPWILPIYETVNDITFTTVVDDDYANRKGFWRMPFMEVVKMSNTHATIYINAAMRKAPPKVFSIMRQIAIEQSALHDRYADAETLIFGIIARRMQCKACNSDQLIEVTEWLLDNTWLISLRTSYADLIRRIKMWQI